MKSTNVLFPLPLSANLAITAGVFVNTCLIAAMFHQDTRWILGKASLGTAARDAVVCVVLFCAVSLALLFCGSLGFRRKFGLRAYLESALLLGSSVILITLGLLVQSRAFNQYFTNGMFKLSGTSFFLWALLPFAGFLLLCRLLDLDLSRKCVSGPQMGIEGK
jgi:hypothetical protein